MRAIRFRLHRMMLWVSVAAINLAAFRALFATRSVVLLAGGMLAFLMFQVGVFRAIRNRGGNRPYWLGFTCGGSIALLSLISADVVPEGIGGTIWRPYFQAVENLIEGSGPFFARMLGNGAILEIVEVLLLALSWFLPLLVASLAGGHLCRLLFRTRQVTVAAA